MNQWKSPIDFIKRIKAHLNHQAYSEGEALQRDFYTAIELSGIRLNDTSYDNLEAVFEIQEFLIHEVCMLHEKEKDACNEKLLRENLSIKKIGEKLQDGKRAFNIYSFNQQDCEYFLIGDIHSDTISLKRILHISDFFGSVVEKKKVRLLFLGDYVDRGKAHLKALEHILLLKFLFPEQVYLLKGNHDDGVLTGNEIKLCIRKPENEPDEDYFLLYLDHLLRNHERRLPILAAYLRFFDSLCNTAFVHSQGVSLLAVHGGIPRPRKEELGYYSYIHCIADLTNMEIIDSINRDICNNMRWSDPCEDEADLRESFGRFRFNLEHFEEFQRNLQFDFLVRGHEAEIEGFKRFFGGRLTTIFSSGAVLEENVNINKETAYEEVAAKVMKLSQRGELALLDLNGGMQINLRSLHNE